MNDVEEQTNDKLDTLRIVNKKICALISVSVCACGCVCERVWACVGMCGRVAWLGRRCWGHKRTRSGGNGPKRKIPRNLSIK